MSRCILVTGDRHATFGTWGGCLYHTLGWLSEDRQGVDLVVHGAAKGIDYFADILAKKHGFSVLPMPAQWDAHGKAAGPRRNLAMLTVALQLQDCGYDVQVFAFHDDLDGSKGTKNMVDQARRAGLQVTVYGSDGQVR